MRDEEPCDARPRAGSSWARAAGHIGVIAPGYYPQVPAGCQPWLPMPGTGACDITGVIPQAAAPQAYDPPSHLIATDNQRPVSGDYPYYVGTALDFYDPGYRAAHAYSALKAAEPLTTASVAALQNDLTDPLAARVVPAVVRALSAAGLSGPDQQAADLLKSWNYRMDAGSPAASLWWTFWGSYLNAVFAPWWQAAKVPVSRDQGDLALTAGLFPLDEDLEAWTLGDPANPVFAGPPGGGSAARGASDHGASDHGASDHGASLPGASAHGLGSASAAIVAAFKKAVAHLSAKLGGAPATWTWGRPARTRYRPRTPALPGREYWAGAAAGRR